MKTTTTLGILFVASLSANIYYYLDSRGNEAILKCAEMQQSGRQIVINNDLAKDYLTEFRDSLLVKSDRTWGGVIPRSTLDEMLCKPGCNAVGYTFAVDTLGTVMPDKNGVFIILNSLAVTYNSADNSVREVRKLEGPNYLPQHWCPPTCTPF